MVILEPKLLQLTFNIKNLQYNYENGIYIEEFLKRAQQTTNALKNTDIKKPKLQVFSEKNVFTLYKDRTVK